MKKVKLLAMALTIFSVGVQCQTKKKEMDQNINAVIQSFSNAVGFHDVATLDELLHKDFRVVANQFKEADQAVILSREVYLGMLSDKKIGGTPYDVEILNRSVFEHTATVEAMLKSENESDMHVFFVLVRDKEETWKIISDTPVIVAR